MATRYQVRRGTKAEWDAASSTILASGEMGYEYDTGRFKIGDGSKAWSSLSYAGEDYAVINAKGDVIVGSSDNTATRLGVGANGEVLTADSTQPTGVKWASGGTPGGTAGGALSGTYPNPSIGTGVVTSANIADGTIVDADIASNAAISASKIAGTVLTQAGPTALGSIQTGTVTGNNFTLDLTTTVLKQTSNTSTTLTGLTGGSEGRIVLLLNAGTGTLTLSHNSSSSTAGNKFSLPSAASYSLPPNQGVLLRYDGTNTSWYAFGSASGSMSLTEVGSMTSASLANIISDETGTGALVFAEAPTLINANLGTPASIDLTNGTNLPTSGLLGVDSGVQTFMALPSVNSFKEIFTANVDYTGGGLFVYSEYPSISYPTIQTPTIYSGTISGTTFYNANIQSFGSLPTLYNVTISYPTISNGTWSYPTFTNPTLGTPLSGNLAYCTGYSVGYLSGMPTGGTTFLQVPSSQNLRSFITDKTGTGLLYFQSGDLGTPTAGVLTNATGYLPANLSGVGALVAAFLTNPTSSNLNQAVTGDSGTGSLLFSNSPSIDSPTLVLSTTLSATNGSLAWDSVNKKVTVGDGTVAREFASSTTVFNTQPTSYTLGITDKDKMIEMNSSSTNTLTVPLNTTAPFPAGTQIRVIQIGTGQTTIGATGGVTLRSRSGFLKISAQYGVATLVKSSTADTWYVYGDLAA